MYLAVGVSLGDLEPKQFQGQAGVRLSVAEARAVAGRGDGSVCCVRKARTREGTGMHRWI